MTQFANGTGVVWNALRRIRDELGTKEIEHADLKVMRKENSITNRRAVQDHFGELERAELIAILRRYEDDYENGRGWVVKLLKDE